MTDQPADRRPSLLLAGCVAAVLYSNFVIDWVLRGFEGMDQIVSKLEAPGQPNATLLRVTDIVCALLVVTLLPRVRSLVQPGRWREVAVWATVTFAIGAALAAVVPSPCGPGQTCDSPSQDLQAWAHDAASIVSDTALFVGMAAMWFATRESGPSWLRRLAFWNFILGGIVVTALLGWFSETGDPSWAAGASQRVHIVFMSAWIVCLGVVAAHPHHLDSAAARPTGRSPSPRQGSATAQKEQ